MCGEEIMERVDRTRAGRKYISRRYKSWREHMYFQHIHIVSLVGCSVLNERFLFFCSQNWTGEWWLLLTAGQRFGIWYSLMRTVNSEQTQHLNNSTPNLIWFCSFEMASAVRPKLIQIQTKNNCNGNGGIRTKTMAC